MPRYVDKEPGVGPPALVFGGRRGGRWRVLGVVDESTVRPDQRDPLMGVVVLVQDLVVPDIAVRGLVTRPVISMPLRPPVHMLPTSSPNCL